MSKGTFSSIDSLLTAVKKFVDLHRTKPENCATLKIEVYLGRGVHTFEYDNTESIALKKVANLKKQLEKAEQDLEAERRKSRKRLRGDSNEHDYQDSSDK